MIPAIEKRADELKRLCIRYGVQRLDLFGSVSTGRDNPDESDLDFFGRVSTGGSRHLCGRLFRLAGGSGTAIWTASGPGGGVGYQESLLPAISGTDEDSRL